MIKGLKEQGNVVVQKIVALSVPTAQHVATRTTCCIAATDKNRHVKDLNEDIHDCDFLVLSNRLVERFDERFQS